MFKEQTGAEPEGAALGNAFKSYRLGESSHLLLECASVQAAWFMQQHYDQSVAAVSYTHLTLPTTPYV